MGEWALVWTIRTGLLLYVVILALVAAGQGRRREGTLGILWGAAGLFFLAHVLIALASVHDWSHEDAVAHTARRTEELVGWRFGGGVYFNYLFVALWIGESLLWRFAPGWRRSRPVWLSLLLHGYLFFIVVNGALIFESGPTRTAGLLLMVAVGGIWVAAKCRTILR
ncbi:MAG: hypothetical protein AAGJ31_00480 [Verrucomicrobiota bacterium]